MVSKVGGRSGSKWMVSRQLEVSNRLRSVCGCVALRLHATHLDMTGSWSFAYPLERKDMSAGLSMCTVGTMCIVCSFRLPRMSLWTRPYGFVLSGLPSVAQTPMRPDIKHWAPREFEAHMD